MKYLFIGGSRDGELVEVENPYIPIQVSKPREIPITFKTPIMEEVSISIETYHPRRLADSDGAEYRVFQVENDVQCVIARLILGYNPK